jgi:hypothetical protein
MRGGRNISARDSDRAISLGVRDARLGISHVGSDRLPIRPSEFDVEGYFALTDSDVAALNERFRHDRRAGAAIQLVFLRASGHSLGQVSTLPRQLYGVSLSSAKWMIRHA